MYKPPPCINCNAEVEAGKVRRGRCQPCDAYWRRYGLERIPVTRCARGDGGQVTTRIPQTAIDLLDVLAEKRGKKRPDLIREAIEAFLAREL